MIKWFLRTKEHVTMMRVPPQSQPQFNFNVNSWKEPKHTRFEKCVIFLIDLQAIGFDVQRSVFINLLKTSIQWMNFLQYCSLATNASSISLSSRDKLVEDLDAGRVGMFSATAHYNINSNIFKSSVSVASLLSEAGANEKQTITLLSLIAAKAFALRCHPKIKKANCCVIF